MTIRALLCLLLVCSLAAPTGVALASGASTTANANANADTVEGVRAPKSALAVQSSNNSTNGSVQHRDPAQVGESNSDDLRAWLVDRLAGRLSEGAVKLSEGEYDRAQQLLGDRYDERLDQLVDVAGETETTRTLNRTRKNQRETARSAEEYRETLEEYRTARENGNNTRARQLGRDLERISQRVARNANETQSGYDRLGNRTGANFTEASVSIENVSENVTKTQAQVNEELFLGTNLTATADGETVSFTDPLTVEGRLRAQNGTAIANEPVRIQVGNRNYTTETNDEGRFTVAYRPVTLPANATNATVEYRPANQSAYLPSSATVPVSVERTTPTVTVTRTPSTVAYNETLTVSGRVSVGETGAPAPVAVFVGERRIATGRAGENGSYRIAARLPAEIESGERAVRAVVPLDGRALARAAATTPVTVESTPTTLSLNGTQETDRTIEVRGRLTTADGAPLADRTVRIEHAGSELATVRTDASGRYSARIGAPDSVPDNGTLDLRATFAGNGTNLGASSANATVELVDLTDDAGGAWSGGGGSGGFVDRVLGFLSTLLGESAPIGPGDLGSGGLIALLLGSPVALGALLVGLLFLAAAGAYAVLTGSDEPEGGFDDELGGTDDADDERAAAAASMAALLDRAHEQISSDATDEGIITLYTATRRLLTEGLPAEYGRTHWEFYRSARERLDEDDSTVLRELTEAYERAAFSSERTPSERAQALLGRVREFRSGGDQPGD